MGDSKEYEPTLDDERVVVLLADDEAPLAPATIDPEERIEIEGEDDADEQESQP